MEPTTTLTAAAIAGLIFSEAFKEGGKALGKGVFDLFAHLMTTIREKFKASGTEGLLVRAEKQPTEANQAMVQTELETQMGEDDAFAKKLTELMKQLEATGAVRQVMASGIEAEGNLEAGDMTQKAQRGHSVEQVMATDLKAEDIKFGNLTQES